MPYFAYSLDMDRDDLARFCAAKNFPLPPLMNERVASLHGHRLVFNCFSPTRLGGTASVVETGRKEDRVWGALYDLPAPYLKILDLREGNSGAYERRTVTVFPEDGPPVDGAVTYVVSKAREIDGHVPPAPSYMALILRNARRLSFPPEYLRFLASVPLKQR
jgi:hypothetical protein